MNHAEPLPETPAAGPDLAKTEAQLRLEREAVALRQNLLRRKQQARARAEQKPDDPPG